MSLNLVEKTYGEKEINAMIDVIHSDKFTMGEKVAEFEKKFAEKFGFNYCVMVNSGSSANLLAMAALTNPKRKNYLKPGDKVLVPCVCWSTSVFPIVQCNLKPVFMDSSKKTLNIKAEDIEKYKDIKGIVMVHILGNSTNMELAMKIAKKKNLIVLEDTCESLSSSFNGTFLGGFGDMGTFSFYFSHHMTTIEGGMVTCKTKEDYELLKCLRAHGWTRHLDSDITFPNVNSKFCFVNIGYNLRPMEIQAAMGLVQLNELDWRNENRKNNYNNITNAIKNHILNHNILKCFRTTENCDAKWFAIPLLLNEEYKDDVKEYLNYLDKNKIQNRPVVTGNFTRQPVIKMINEDINPENFPDSEIIHFCGFYIGCPTHETLDSNTIQLIVDKLFNFHKFKKPIPFFKKPFNINKSIEYVNDAINSTWISIGGKYIDLCEDKLKPIVGCKHVILTQTGTAAIHCMIKCLKYKFPNCKKIYVPNNTYIACINSLLHEFPIEYIELIDVDINTLNIEDVSNLEKNACLFVIHNIGSITNIPKIKRERPDLIIFEDNAEGYFGKYEGKQTGSEGIASSLSFNMNKNFTCGQGGAFCTNDDELYQYIKSYTRHGFTGKKFHYQIVGNNYRMTNVNAAILYSQIEQYDAILKDKKNMYNLFKKYINSIPNVSLQKIESDVQNSYWNIVIRIKNNSSYENIEEQLKKYNIDSRPMFLPIQSFDHLQNIKYPKNTNSEKIFNEYLFIPFNCTNKNILKYISKNLNIIVNEK